MPRTDPELLERSYDPDPAVRRDAVRALCPCKLKSEDLRAWERVFELTGDPDLGVRRNAFHGIIDGLPRHLTPRAADVLEGMREDTDPRLRRNVRKVLARYRRTGRIDEG